MTGHLFVVAVRVGVCDDLDCWLVGMAVVVVIVTRPVTVGHNRLDDVHQDFVRRRLVEVVVLKLLDLLLLQLVQVLLLLLSRVFGIEKVALYAERCVVYSLERFLVTIRICNRINEVAQVVEAVFALSQVWVVITDVQRYRLIREQLKLCFEFDERGFNS